MARFTWAKKRRLVSCLRANKRDLVDSNVMALIKNAALTVWSVCLGNLVAIKQISKQHTSDSTFQREMDAFLHIRMAGDHPNICGLRENFDEGNYYYLVLDLVQGGEMFDHLIKDGAYSEADAARLVREVGSALSFLHGIGLVHSDLKPENLYVQLHFAFNF